MENKNGKKPIFVLKPKFNALYYLTNKILLNAMVVIVLNLFIVENAKGIQVFYLPIAYVVFEFIRFLIMKLKTNKLTYYFFEDKVVIDKNGKKDKIMYSEIEYIKPYKRNYAHTFFNYGSIAMKVKGKNFYINSIDIDDINNYDENITKIGQLIFKVGENDE